jgi:hypothetical protein
MGISDRIDTLTDRANSLAGEDATVALELHEQLDRHQRYSDHFHEKTLRHAVIISEECGGLAAALDDSEAADEIVDWINDTYTNEETNRDYRVALRDIGRIVRGDNEDIPDSLQHVESGYSSDYDPTPDPREILRWEEDIQPMLNAAQNARDRALVSLQFDAGLRGGELKDLVVGDVQDHEHGLQVTVDGKMGRRTVALIPSVPHVTDWLDEHPDPRSDAPLWSKLSKAEAISDRMFYDALQRVADRAGVDRPVTPTNFRKSSAAFLARRNLNQTHINEHHGWVPTSDAAARYIRVFAEDTDRELARLHGVDVRDEEPADISPVECPRCSVENGREATFCSGCGQTLDREAMQVVETVNEFLDEQMVESDDPAERKKSLEAKREVNRRKADLSIDELHSFFASDRDD